MNKKKKLLRRIILSTVVLIFVLLLAISNYLFEYAIYRKGTGGNRNVKVAENLKNSEEKSDKLKETKKIKKTEANQYFEKNIEKEDFVKTGDGLNLKLYYLNKPENNKWVLLIHGYRADHKDMYVYAKMYHQNGYNVLMPDLRACGASEGKYIGMGILDKEDMKIMLDWILNKNKDAEIVVHGNSMGAATALLLSGEKEAEKVKAFVGDSGYTSVYEIFKSELHLRFGLPSFPILDLAGIFCNLKAGYSFNQVSVVDAISKSTKPILLIHGKKDDFVPFSMMEILYNAKKTGDKLQLISENAAHVESIFDLGDEYEKTVLKFIR
ncbi:MAG: alpha/beta hydrolase [Erysipelotrichaceae bacterium]|nr:alpha/beta hydrolase [Erysipelotrichaceae bacterium]